MASLKEHMQEKVLGDVVTRAEAETMAENAARKAVQEAMATFLDQQKPAAATGLSAELREFVQGLAVQLAEVGNQGTGKQVVDPAVLERRSKARARMIELIMAAYHAGKRPEYALTATVHLDDQLITPLYQDANRTTQQRHIFYNGVPNEAMQPVDDAAKEIYAAFAESIGKSYGTVPTLIPVDRRGNLLTPGGNVFQSLPAIPPGFTGEVEIDPASLPKVDLPHNGLEVLGQAGRTGAGREVNVNILGSIVNPAKQLVA